MGGIRCECWGSIVPVHRVGSRRSEGKDTVVGGGIKGEGDSRKVPNEQYWKNCQYQSVGKCQWIFDFPL